MCCWRRRKCFRMRWLSTPLPTLSLAMVLSLTSLHSLTNQPISFVVLYKFEMLTHLNLKLTDAMFLIFSGFLSELMMYVVQSETPRKWKCDICHIFEHEKKKCVLNHLEARHYPSAGHNCPFCGRFCKTTNALNSHKAKYHKQLYPGNKFE